MWNSVIDGDDFQVTIHYLTSVDELVKVTNQCQIAPSESYKSVVMSRTRRWLFIDSPIHSPQFLVTS